MDEFKISTYKSKFLPPSEEKKQTEVLAPEDQISSACN